MEQSTELLDLVRRLRALSAHVVVEGDRLIVNVPKGALPEDLRASITAHKPALIAFLRNGGHDDQPALRPRSSTGDTPLSFAQERMWYLQQLAPQSPAYNMVVAAFVDGYWDAGAFRRAMEHIARRHDMLRASFSARDGVPRQHIAGELTGLPLVEHDFSGLPPDRREQRAHAEAAALARQPFDLAQGPLWRVLMARLANDRHVVVIVVHHIIGDRWSLDVLLRELGALYVAYGGGTRVDLPPLALQYADFAAWQRELLSGSRLEKLLAYWKTALDGVEPLDLPTDHVRGPVMSTRGRQMRATISADGLGRLRSFATREGVTPFVSFLSAYAALLSRYTMQTDIPIGVPIANRSRAGLEGIVGVLINTLVYRADLSGDPSFAELAQRMRAVTLAAIAHQDLPFERLVRELAPARDPSRTPVFQVMFNFADALDAVRSERGGLLRPMQIEHHTAQFDLSLTVEVGEVATITMEYNADLFEAATIERFLDGYTRLLQAATADPARPFSRLPLLSPEQRDDILTRINETAVPFPGTTVAQLFADQVARAPHRTAVSAGGIDLTYAELDARAARIAQSLIARGVRAGSRVAVCLARSPDLIASLLAVLRTGGTYLPIDPRHSLQRALFMIEDSSAALVLTGSEHAALFEDAGVPVMLVDRDVGDHAAESAAPPAPATSAYVIYTSGSTGTPKGVEISHASLANFLLSMQREPGIGADDSLLAVTTVAFDIAALEIFLPLISGARVILAARDDAADGRALRALLVNSKPSMMQATPAMWRSLVDAGWSPDETPELRILTGGEALPRDLAADLLTRGREVWNMYGPTETTVWSTVHRVSDTARTIPIGRPVANTQVFVLDAALEPLPIGVPGELYIGGAGVARGYLNRPELTAERFVANPFGSGRLYRTGDKVRLRDDLALEHRGRLDDQIKLRGFRIEPGEIEAALSTLEGVVASAVAVRRERLTAYIVFRNGEDMTGTEVRRSLRQRLPDYMIPSLVVAVDDLPLTPTGKIDRRALPDPMRTTKTVREYHAPTTPTEIAIATVWSSLLAVERVGTADNFFDLGGHSLLSMQAVHEIEQATGWRPDARLFFFHTLAQIAASRDAPPVRVS